jgi:hypothetical protein
MSINHNSDELPFGSIEFLNNESISISFEVPERGLSLGQTIGNFLYDEEEEGGEEVEEEELEQEAIFGLLIE